MNLEQLTTDHQGEWVVENLDHAHEHLDDMEKLVEVCRPRLVLGEATYRELAYLIDPNFLSQKIRAAELKRVEFAGFDHNTLIFEVPSSEFDENHIKYANLVQFSDWDEVGQMTDLKPIEKARLLLWQGNVKLHCTCPSQLYWGYSSILTVLDSAIYPETRKPIVRNPRERGICCKHLNRTLQVLPFASGRIAAELKNQFGF